MATDNMLALPLLQDPRRLEIADEYLKPSPLIPMVLPWEKLQRAADPFRPGKVLVIGGPPGHGKTWIAQSIILRAQNVGAHWFYLALEDTAVNFQARMLCLLTDDWTPLSIEKETLGQRKEILDTCSSALESIMQRVVLNPRTGYKGDILKNGRVVLPALPYQQVLIWLAAACSMTSLVVIDPLALIEFGVGLEEYKNVSLFFKSVIALAARYETNVVICVHTIKRHGAARNYLLSVDDLQGAAVISREAHTVLLFDGHDPKTSMIYGQSGNSEQQHNRTMIIGKARYGRGHGWKFAFNLKSPNLEEVGAIVG
jgi:hypothetical protein